MNLAILEKLVVTGDLSADALRILLNFKGECEWLDFKEDLQLGNNKAACGFAKDMVAMKNTGGGYVIVGVEDKTWRPVGIQNSLMIDTKMLRDQVRKHTGLDLDIFLVEHELSIDGGRKRFAIILVKAGRKRSKRRMPSVCKNDSYPKDNFGIRRGDIYARKGDSTVRIDSQDDLEELLDSLEDSSDRDALELGGGTSPFAVVDGQYRLLERGFEAFIGRDSLREQVRSALEQDPRIWIINVHGPGGAGKSALVNWVTYDCYQNRRFEAILQLTGKDTVLTTQGIRRHGRSLYSLDDLIDQILLLFQETADGTLAERQHLVLEYLNAWKTLIVLDNMETVTDGRILQFIQKLPPTSQCKVLLTSRTKTGGWELPIPVNELSMDETREFVRIKSNEMGVAVSLDNATCSRLLFATGGLPLAIQWTLGRVKTTRDFETAISEVRSSDSPVLEFSFRNIWSALPPDARVVLAALTIFDSPPTLQNLVVATEWKPDRVEVATVQLSDVTLITRSIRDADGLVVFVALPITLSFAQNQFNTMGDLEAKCRQRVNKFNEQMDLRESEVSRFASTFERFGLSNENEKRAAILCSRGQSEMFSGSTDQADAFFKQARDLAPHSAYVFAMSASYELARNRIGSALDLARKGCSLATKKTGSLAYTILARICDVQRDRYGRLRALEKAVEYDGTDLITRHQYGVALSRAGKTEEAIAVFSGIIEEELRRPFATETLMMAIKTRVINYRRLSKFHEADKDIDLAEEIIGKNPHLERSAYVFADLKFEA